MDLGKECSRMDIGNAPKASGLHVANNQLHIFVL